MRLPWKDIENIPRASNNPWSIVGDFNNVLRSTDIIGGRMVIEQEFRDLQGMMDICGLNEMDNLEDYYTWHNKQVTGPIFSIIDRVLGNSLWFQKMDVQLKHLLPSVSDHVILQITKQTPLRPWKSNFKFINCVTEFAGFQEVVTRT